MTMASSSHTPTPIYWMALGTFAIGTEGFMIAPLLPRLAGDLSVSVAAAGQLVTVFALTYAFSSPILTALTGSLDRRRLLVFSMIGFAARTQRLPTQPSAEGAAYVNVREPSAAPNEKPRNMKEALSESTIGATSMPAMPISRVC